MPACSASLNGRLRDRLIAAARGDDRITAAAVVGSGAINGEDAWSDIDLALRLADGLKPDDVAVAWTTRIYESASAVDHLDVWSDSTLFRVFLLSSSLQVDLSFWTANTFAASGASFRLLFGEANEPRPPRSFAPERPGTVGRRGRPGAAHVALRAGPGSSPQSHLRETFPIPARLTSGEAATIQQGPFRTSRQTRTRRC